jgi:hypothetical protein
MNQDNTSATMPMAIAVAGVLDRNGLRVLRKNVFPQPRFSVVKLHLTHFSGPNKTSLVVCYMFHRILSTISAAPADRLLWFSRVLM